MAVETAEDLATFFDTDDFAVAAVITPNGGAAVTVSILLDEPQEIHGLGIAGIAQANRRVMVRKSEIDDPTNGTIAISGVTYRIVEPELDLTRLIWSFAIKR